MRTIFMAALLFSAPAQAEVISSVDYGFEVASAVTIKGAPERVFAELQHPERWWNPAHSYSGKAENLSIEARAGGCFCETNPANGALIEHGRVIHLHPGKLLRLSTALGPLQAEGVSGSLTWTLKAVPGGTEVRQSYVVGGYVRSGFKGLAPLVDQVMSEQLGRLAARF